MTRIFEQGWNYHSYYGTHVLLKICLNNAGRIDNLLRIMRFHYSYRTTEHNNVIKWKHFPRYWPFVRGIYRSPLDSPHKGQRRGALKYSLIYAWTKGWSNIRDAGDLRPHRAHYDITIMINERLTCCGNTSRPNNHKHTDTKLKRPPLQSNNIHELTFVFVK